jgi:alcohol dehydrogenase class IV
MTVHPGAGFFPAGDLKTRLHFGRPACDVLADLLDGPWTLVISAGGLRRSNDFGLFDGLRPPHAIVVVPPGLITLRSLAAAWRTGPPEVIGIGAGSVLDAAKLVRLANLQGAFPTDRRGWRAILDADEARLICLPTTAGSGSELTPTASLWDDGIKSSIDGPALRPSDAVYDPALLATADAEIRTAALWDAVAHSLEALWSRHATDLSDRYASFALGTIMRAVRLSGKTDDDVLPDLALGSAAAGAAISITRTGIAHALSYPLTRRYGLRHGLAAGLYAVAAFILLPDIDSERAARITRALGDADGAACEALVAHWRASAADRLVASTVTPDAILEPGDLGLDPDRARLSVIPPEPAVVAAICRNGVALTKPPDE